MGSELSANQDVSASETERKRQAFGRLFQETLGRKEEGVLVVEYNLPYPKEDFLRFLVAEKNVVLHGSPHRNLETLEPRQANDGFKVAGNRKAVYAVTDTVFPIFHAIQDKEKLQGTITSIVSGDMETGEVAYKFIIPKNTLSSKPWVRGMVYILNKDQFQAERDDDGILNDEWTSGNSVRPIAKLEVGPEDFCFLDQVVESE